MSNNQLNNILLKDGKFTCFHRIKELTKGEYVSIGSDGNILRWKETGKNTQKWLIFPVSPTIIPDNKKNKQWYKILTLQNGECMSMGLKGNPGNIYRWKKRSQKDELKDPRQMFAFVNPETRGELYAYNIVEPTRDEYVSVGSNGNILRWMYTGKDSQVFILEPIDEVRPKKEEPEITVGKKRFAQDNILTFPLLKSTETFLPKESERCLIGVDLLPSVLVDDQNYTDKIKQVKAQPYYYLVQYRFWERLDPISLVAGMEFKEKTTISYGMSEEHFKKVETTLGVVVSLELSRKKTIKTKEKETEVGSEVSQKLATQFSWQQKWTKEDREKKESKFQKELEKVIKDKGSRTIFGWQIIELYTLYNYDELVVQEWKVKTDEIRYVDDLEQKNVTE